MLSTDFGIPILPGRMTPDQIGALDVTARLVLWIAGTANAERGTFYVTTGEFAAWAGCSHRQAGRALDALEASGWVLNVVRRAHGNSGELGAMFRKRNDVDASMAARIYQRVFELRAHAEDRKQMGDEVGTQAGDLRLWTGICQGWRAAGHNPADVRGLLDAYTRKRKAVQTIASARVGDEPDYAGYQVNEAQP